ncbi:MAG: HAMP domain-containing histidine kinase [Acidobacteria bacterium]|nr:HAMP domain-containing histidine kinase [Acidobacteriota bacterium]
MATAALLTTFFDTPERTDRAAREAQVAAIAQAALLRPLLEAIAAPAAFVNGEREILICNAAFARLADMTHEAVVGRRFGEAVACVHAFEPPAGCGTTESCAWCGGGQALRRARMTQQVAEAPCRIRTLATEGSGAIDAEITCTPLVVEGVSGVVVVVKDLSDRHQRDVLERIFFHDVLNAAGGLRGLLQTWHDLPADETQLLAPIAARLAEQLVEDIESHRDLVSAERGTLPVHRSQVAPHDLLADLRALYRQHDVCKGRTLEVRVDRGAPAIDTDPVLLRRVLGNLVKNALEATPPGGIVRVMFATDEHGPRFSVHNRTAMTDAAQRLIFQRAFSTKGPGRGLGTYSARLIAEQYLGATLSFDSRPLFGTTFTIAWPAGDLAG